MSWFRRGFMWCAIVVAVHFTGAWVAAAPKFILTPLTSPSTGQDAYGYSINASGQVAGYGFVGGTDHAFLWSPTTPNGTTGSLLDLGAAPNNMGLAQAINDFGQVAGMYYPLPTATLLWTPQAPHGTTGSLTNLGDVATGRGDTFAYGINSFGQIAVQSTLAGGIARAALWTPNAPNNPNLGTWRDLGNVPGGDRAAPRAINARGQVTGSAGSQAGAHAFLWSPNNANGTTGTMVDIGKLPGGQESAQAMAINAGGQVAGWSDAAAGLRAFLWTPNTPNGSSGTMINLGTLIGDSQSFAYGINGGGYVVGSSSLNNDPNDTHAFLYSPAEGMFDLNDLLNGSYTGWTLYSGQSINDYGQITGIGLYDPDGPGPLGSQVRAFLLTPTQAIPEPGAMVVWGVAGVMLLKRQRTKGSPA